MFSVLILLACPVALSVGWFAAMAVDRWAFAEGETGESLLDVYC